jgi:hypothetical protein
LAYRVRLQQEQEQQQFLWEVVVEVALQEVQTWLSNVPRMEKLRQPWEPGRKGIQVYDSRPVLEEWQQPKKAVRQEVEDRK